MHAPPPAEHHTIVAVDVEKFGDRRRTNQDRLAIRKGLYQALSEAFARCGMSWDITYHEDRGDGAFALIGQDVPKSHLAVQLPGQLATELRRHNRSCAPQTRIRLRLAIHAGEVHRDEHGAVGAAVDLTFRLLNADALREELAQAPGDIVLITSDWFYDDVIRHTPQSRPATYREVVVATKETNRTAWVGRPEADPDVPPLPPAIPAGPSGEQSLQLHALVWEAGVRHRINPDPVAVNRRGIAVVVAPPPAATALANVVTGVSDPIAGSVSLDRVDITGRQPSDRRIALIPLSGGLLPHLTVMANIAYARGRAGRSRAADIAHRLQLGDVLKLRPHDLSPVQRLRVAVARALCAQPEPVAVVIEDRDGHHACRAAALIARDQDLAVLVITDSVARAGDLNGQLYATQAEGAGWGGEPGVTGMGR